MTAARLSEIRQVVASLLEESIQKLTLIEANKDYVFEYIYPPSVMEKKSKPNRLLIVILFVVFGGFLGMIINFVVSISVSSFSSKPPIEVGQMVDKIRLP